MSLLALVIGELALILWENLELSQRKRSFIVDLLIKIILFFIIFLNPRPYDEVFSLQSSVLKKRFLLPVTARMYFIGIFFHQ